MGERFRRAQAEGFQHRTSAAHDRRKAPTLLSRLKSDVTTREFTCEETGDSAPVEGAPVVLQRQGDQVVVTQGNRRVGIVEPSEVAALSEAVEIGSGSLRGKVESCSSIGGFFTIRLAEAG